MSNLEQQIRRIVVAWGHNPESREGEDLAGELRTLALEEGAVALPRYEDGGKNRGLPRWLAVMLGRLISR